MWHRWTRGASLPNILYEWQQMIQRWNRRLFQTRLEEHRKDISSTSGTSRYNERTQSTSHLSQTTPPGTIISSIDRGAEVLDRDSDERKKTHGGGDFDMTEGAMNRDKLEGNYEPSHIYDDVIWFWHSWLALI